MNAAGYYGQRMRAGLPEWMAWAAAHGTHPREAGAEPDWIRVWWLSQHIVLLQGLGTVDISGNCPSCMAF